MALVRVYCGLTATDQDATPPGSETWLTVAVVDDAGRLLDICDISDDAPGFSELGTLLAERSNGLESVAIAADSDEHIVTRLLTAAGRYLAYTDEDSAEDYAARFSNDAAADEIQSSPAERRAIGLARALQAGVLSAVAQPTPRDLFGIKPVLAAHAAVTNGRQSAAATLREVLRELYPAALRAFPDPAEPIPLAILDALPEPGPLGGNGNGTGRGRDAQAIAELAEAGVADQDTLAEAVSALREAIAETPRRTGMNRSVTNAVAETVRQSVAAVRACDAGAAALVSVLSARMPAPSAAAGPARPLPSRSRAAETSGTEPTAASQRSSTDESGRGVAGRRSRTAPARPRSAPSTPAPPQPTVASPLVTPAASSSPLVTPAASSSSAVPAAAAGVHRSGLAEPAAADQSAPRTRAARRAAEKRAEEQVAAAQGPAPVQSPAAAPVPVHVPPPPPVPVQAPPAPMPVPPPASVPTPVNPPARTQPEPTVVRSPKVPTVPPPGLTPAFPARTGGTPSFPAAPSEPAAANFTVAPGPVPTGPVLDAPAVAGRAAERRAEPPSGELPRIDFTRGLDLPVAEPSRADRGEQREGRVVPPWQSIDLPAEPPALRLVEPAPLTDPALSPERPQFRGEPGGDPRLEPRPLRLVEGDSGPNGTAAGVTHGTADSGLNGASSGLNGTAGDAERSSRRAGSRMRSDKPAEPPAKDESDGDLLIFAEARSAWFTDRFGEDDDSLTFDSPSDEGWRAARHAAEPAVGAETSSGLPRRVPQQNLVPGSPVDLPERPLRVVRDAAAIAAHTSGYFRGWRRGQEVGGYRVGGRPGRESAGGWDFTRDQRDDDERGYEYRSARR